MKKLLLLALSIICFAPVHSQTNSKALFIGNSYTYVNDLPAVMRSLAAAGGITLSTESSAPGGYTFQSHVTNATTTNFLATPGFDFVILQEQSQRPSFPQSQVQQEVYPYATQLDQMFHAANPCGQTVFFMTWGRKYGDAQNCQFWAPVCTYEGMQFELRRSYLNMAQQNEAIVAPVGVAWWEAMLRDTTLELYSPDESHPALTGTYLAACVFYGSMYRQPSLGLNYYAGLDSLTATFLQQVADDVVFDSLTLWRIGLDDVTASFQTNILGATVSFTDQSQNATAWHWDFGDGNTSTQQSPLHTYASNGTYSVTLTVNDGCDTVSYTSDVAAFVTAVGPDLGQLIQIYPNPSNGRLSVELREKMEEIRVVDVTGRVIWEMREHAKVGAVEIDLGNHPSGMYLLQYKSDQGIGTQRILLERQ